MSQVITIKAPTKQALSKARTRVELVISSAINSRTLDYTHFLSLPLSNEQTAAKLEEFQQQVNLCSTAVKAAMQCRLNHSLSCWPQQHTYGSARGCGSRLY
jgi:hypothetical protein